MLSTAFQLQDAPMDAAVLPSFLLSSYALHVLVAYVLMALAALP